MLTVRPADIVERARTMLCILLLWPVVCSAGQSWETDRSVGGIALEAQSQPSGFKAYRGAVTVCVGLDGLQSFVSDASRFEQWLPYTEEARALASPGEAELYYLRNESPWPLRSRDMIYRLTPLSTDEGELRIALRGKPDALPRQAGAVRMKSAEGLWVLRADGARTQVEFSLAVDPGPAPTAFINRRMAATVGGALANLRERFPCPETAAD